MSIIISNISEEYSREGVQRYRVSLNNIPLVEFNHYSEDGMAYCVKLAYIALENIDIDAKVAEYQEQEKKRMELNIQTLLNSDSYLSKGYTK